MRKHPQYSSVVVHKGREVEDSCEGSGKHQPTLFTEKNGKSQYVKNTNKGRHTYFMTFPKEKDCYSRGLVAGLSTRKYHGRTQVRYHDPRPTTHHDPRPTTTLVTRTSVPE